MKIYTNQSNRICAIGNTTDSTLLELVIPDNVFPVGASDDLIKCYTCIADKEGNYIVNLMVPPELAEQIDQQGRQNRADQERIAELTIAMADLIGGAYDVN